VYKTKTILMVLIIGLAGSFSAAAQTIYVDAAGPNSPGTGRFEDPFRAIADAIDSADSGDIVEIRPGVYTGDGNYNLNPAGRSITICSIDANDANVVATTIIDANDAGRGFSFTSGEDANCVISGLTIRNGITTTSYGGNIYCFESSPTIRNCIIENGYSANVGGGVFCGFSNPYIIGCAIVHNSAQFYGGAIACYYSEPRIIGCKITANTAGSEGGALDGVFSGPTFTNCVIADNRAVNSAGLNCYSSDETIGETSLVNCTVAGNLASGFGGGVGCQDGAGCNITNSIFWENSANQGRQIYISQQSSCSIHYCDIQGADAAVYDPCDNLLWAAGNLDTDPCFAAFDPQGDANDWDFHLQSAYGRFDANSQSWVHDVNTSLCIDAGDPNADWSGEPWPNGRRTNMGAFAAAFQASMNGNVADFDLSGEVNFLDFAGFADRWSAEHFCIEDLSGNGVVDFADLKIFSANWLWQRQ